ncbi:hypothetical protein [Dyella koreensis]|uniref:Peptidase A2 domain-containing protein n=1 Tax=Dyella koreensis TaxID=311235 RepID=A0ABW8K8K5_9GAMM
MTLILLAATAMAAAPAKSQVLPTVYEAGHFYAVPETPTGQRMKLLVDTGGGGVGGLYWITPEAAKRLNLKTHTCHAHGASMPMASAPAFKAGRGLPATDDPCPGIMLVEHSQGAMDGMLGSNYLGGRIWTFDYPTQRLVLNATPWHPVPGSHATPLGFQKNAAGKATRAFPRIVIKVDGQPLDMLLDTGATAHPTEAGRQAAGTPTVDGTGVASYITTSQLERWHKAHPDWRVVDQGDDLFPKHPVRLIEVPALEIAGWSVGPVWFTERQDSSFHGMMAELMDKPPEGAIGGNVLQHFVMTLDYPNATAYFQCGGACRSVTPPPVP